MWKWLTRSEFSLSLAPRAHHTLLCVELLEAREVPAILIQIDYSYDNGFFTNNPEARAIIERVASELGNSISANLSTIVPSGANSWTASFFNPATGAVENQSNLVLGANTIKVYVGSRTLGGGAAGVGGFGGYGISGSQPWISTIQTRGWSGFSLWGGSIAFDNTKNWHFGQTTSGLAGNELDFYSVATHEMGHVLGLGTAPLWQTYSSGGYFYGPNASAVYGGAVPLSSDGAHWADGVRVGGQAVSLDPTINFGQRIGWSALDAAALRDVGWLAPNALPVSPAPPPPPAPVPPTVERPPVATVEPVAFTGSTNGVVTMYTVVNGVLTPTGQRFVPFPGFMGTIRVAGGDFNGDGIQDYAFTVGAGPQSVVQIMNGRDGSLMVNQTAIFPGFRGGLFIAAADIDRDGKAELVVSADAGAGPHIQTFRVEGASLVLQSSFFAFDNPFYRGGARVAAGDLNRDGFADVVVTTGGQVFGRAAMYSGADLARGVATRLYGDFNPFPGYIGGLNAAVGDMNGDGYGELVFSIDRGGPAHVKIWSGISLLSSPWPGSIAPTASFYAFSPFDLSGARLALRDTNGDGLDELITTSGNRLNSAARVFGFTGAGGPLSYPLGSLISYDGVYAGLQSNPATPSSSDQPTSDDPSPAALGDGTEHGVYTVVVDPQTHKCTCAMCTALANLVESSEPIDVGQASSLS